MRSMTSINLFFLSIARMRHVTTVVIELRSKESGIVASSVEHMYDDVVKFHAVLSAAADALGFAPPPINTSDVFFASLRTASTKPHLRLLALFRDAHSLTRRAFISLESSNPRRQHAQPRPRERLSPGACCVRSSHSRRVIYLCAIRHYLTASDFHQARAAALGKMLTELAARAQRTRGCAPLLSHNYACAFFNIEARLPALIAHAAPSGSLAPSPW